jgi:hypothetical protein
MLCQLSYARAGGQGIGWRFRSWKTHSGTRRTTERANRELIERAERAARRPAGVTVVFAFLLAVPFAKGRARVTTVQRDVFTMAVLVLWYGLPLWADARDRRAR